MSILDTVMNAVEKHPDVSNQQHSSLIQAAMEMFGNSGGLSALMSNAQSHGLGHIVSSWIGNGPNQQVSPEQVQNIVGQDRINELAQRASMPSGLAGAALSRVLPMIVDKLTPNGNLQHAA